MLRGKCTVVNQFPAITSEEVPARSTQPLRTAFSISTFASTKKNEQKSLRSSRFLADTGYTACQARPY